MDWSTYRSTFAFVGQALDGTGGFRPQVSGAGVDQRLCGPTELVRYTREGDAKFAGRNALAVYENHLRSACARFVSFLGRNAPMRLGTDAPLVACMRADADLRGNDLDTFWRRFAMQAAARGTMLLVIDKLSAEGVTTLGDQERLRALPYLRPAYPEDVVSYRLDADSGLFDTVTLAGMEWVDGELQETERDYDTEGWRLRIRPKDRRGKLSRDGWRTVAEGAHGLGACPVLAFTEDGSEFPSLGRFVQIADLSRDLFNARSELREILRAQTFSLLTLQVDAAARTTFNAAETAATIGTHSMLVHEGIAPSFIAPDPGPAQTYGAAIAELQQAIARVSMDDAVNGGGQVESGLARKLRFEALNAAVNGFAKNLERLEMRMWALFHRALGTTNRVTVTWPADFSLTDTRDELDILLSMQATGFPDAVQAAKRAEVVRVEFDSASPDEMAALLAAIDEQAQEPALPDPITDPIPQNLTGA